MSADHRGGVVLALAGGGTKGISHIGVLKLLEELDVPIAGIVGTSMGSIMGGLYAVGRSADDLSDLVFNANIMDLIADRGMRLVPEAGDHIPPGENNSILQKWYNRSLKTIGPRGLMQANALTSYIDEHTSVAGTQDYLSLPIPFACVATDLTNGDRVVMTHGSLAHSIRASSSIPGLFEPVPLDGRLLVDGGLVANLPVEVAKELFPGRPVIAVSFTKVDDLEPEDLNSLPAVIGRTLDIMMKDQIAYNESIADLVIYPDMTGLSTLDSSGYEDIWARGHDAALAVSADIIRLSAGAAPTEKAPAAETRVRIVRSFKVEGMRRSSAADIERVYGKKWIGNPYDSVKVADVAQLYEYRDDINNIKVTVSPAKDGADDEVDIVFSVEKRPAFEYGLIGYSTNMHPHRWLGLNAVARDLMSDGDSALADVRVGLDEWAVRARYFTPISGGTQWGFGLNYTRDRYELGDETYDVDGISGRALLYHENSAWRYGYGVGAMNTYDSVTRDRRTAWGPMAYFGIDTLDNTLKPTKGIDMSGQVWYDTDGIWVSETRASLYHPITSTTHMKFDLGLKTGKYESRSHRAYLGDHEELISLAASPYVGDQVAWAQVGLGRDFYTSWWGAIRGELFAAYGMSMMNWGRENDAWEAGVGFSVPGQLFNGRILFVYGSEGGFTIGFTIGQPQFRQSRMP